MARYALKAWILASSPDEPYRDASKAVVLASRATELGGANTPYFSQVCAAAHEVRRARTGPRVAGEGPRRDHEGPGRNRRPAATNVLVNSGAFMGGRSAGNPSQVPLASSAGDGIGLTSFYGSNYVLPATGKDPRRLAPDRRQRRVLHEPLAGQFRRQYPRLLRRDRSLSGRCPPASSAGTTAARRSRRPATLRGIPSTTPSAGRTTANYAGTVTVSPTNIPGAYPTNPSGVSLDLADYTSASNFTPGSFSPGGTAPTFP